MEKNWYESKTVWAAVIMALAAVYQIFVNGQLDLDAIRLALEALGLYGLRTALK